jgi:hypothetical protein
LVKGLVVQQEVENILWDQVGEKKVWEAGLAWDYGVDLVYILVCY